MAHLISDFLYFLSFFITLIALVLILEWVFYFVPGAQLNSIRKMLFNVSYPFLSWSERFFSIRIGLFNSRGLFTAVLLLAVVYLGIPWLVFGVIRCVANG
jgi:hypothetical protein